MVLHRFNQLYDIMIFPSACYIIIMNFETYAKKTKTGFYRSKGSFTSKSNASSVARLNYQVDVDM